MTSNTLVHCFELLAQGMQYVFVSVSLGVLRNSACAFFFSSDLFTGPAQNGSSDGRAQKLVKKKQGGVTEAPTQGDLFLDTGVITRNHVREETVVVFPFHLHAIIFDPFHVRQRSWIRFVKHMPAE